MSSAQRIGRERGGESENHARLLDVYSRCGSIVANKFSSESNGFRPQCVAWVLSRGIGVEVIAESTG